MNSMFKTAILTTAVAAMTLTALPAANAGEWRRHHRHSNGDAIAAGVVGLAAGALIAGALSNPRPAYATGGYYDDGYYGDDYYEQRRYVRPRPAPVRNYYPVRRQVVYKGGLEPWSREWVRYCSNRYRTFDARTGTFVGYDGQEHFCAAN